jgi:hypothetical protein
MGVAEGLTSMTWARSWQWFPSSTRTHRGERSGEVRAYMPCGAAAGVGGGARWWLGQGFHAARVWGRGALRRVGQAGHARQWAGGNGLVGPRGGANWAGREGGPVRLPPFFFVSSFFSFSLFYFLLIQIEFLIKCMRHKFTHQTK